MKLQKYVWQKIQLRAIKYLNFTIFTKLKLYLQL